jgi:hypothetical protein
MKCVNLLNELSGWNFVVGTLRVMGTSLLERFALWELRYWNAARYGKTCGFIGTSLFERCALLELRYWKTFGFIGTLRVIGIAL